MARLSIVDLFAGAGGLSEGFRSNPRFKTVSAVEHDRLAAATYDANHPGVDVYAGDIEEWLHDRLPSADIVVGGPPCQGFSNLGARHRRDPRNALWRRYVDALERIGPLYFVLENVSDFLRAGQFASLKRETGKGGRLAEYRLEYAVLNSADFGAPQIRRRAVVIGSYRDLHAPGLPIGYLSGRSDEWVTVRDALDGVSIEPDGIDLPDVRSEHNGDVLPGPFKTIDLHLGRRPTETSLRRYQAIPEGGNRFDIPFELLAPCWRNHRSGSGDVMGRLRWDRPAVTIRTEFWKPEKGRYLHPVAHRPITHLEAARLQGFPDDYLWYGSKTDIGRQIGNAVPIALATAIANHLANQLV